MFTRVRISGKVAGICLLAFSLAPVPITPAVVAAPANVTPAATQESFASPEDAVTALVRALQANDAKELRAILGPNSDKLISSGDPVADMNARQRFLDGYMAKHTLSSRGDGQQVLVVGPDDWPLPIPIVRTGDAWRFDATEGAEEVVDRRIGQNELLTIRALLAAVEAEQDYFDRVKRGSGTGAYAQRMLSQPNSQDGLYWDVDPGEAPSPLGPLIEQARSEGYPGEMTPAGVPVPYHGYLYRVLKAQGPNAPGGAQNYMRDGQMTEGFAIVAWPAAFENSGIMTFVVDQEGIVFQKDLGPNTAKIAGGIMSFDPDVTWTRIDISDSSR
jgi:hypothetical protein